MPGLLQTPDDMFGSARFASALAAELLVRTPAHSVAMQVSRMTQLDRGPGFVADYPQVDLP